MSFLDRQSKKERKGSYYSRVLGRSSPYTKESPRKKPSTPQNPEVIEGLAQRPEVSEGFQEAGTSERTAIVIGEGTAEMMGEEVASGSLGKRKREENDGTFNKNKCIN
jgi:hypothetical protein